MKCYVMHMDTQSPQTEKMLKNAMNIIKLLKKGWQEHPTHASAMGTQALHFSYFS